MKTITLFVRRNCCLCRNAHDVVSQVRQKHPFHFEVHEVDALPADDPRRVTYALDIPVIEIDGEVAFKHSVTEDALIEQLAPSGEA